MRAPAAPGGTRRAGTPPGGDGALAASSPTALSSSTNTPPPAITAHDLAACAEALSRLAARLPQGAGVLALVAEARRLALLVSAGPKGPGLPGVAGLARDGPRGRARGGRGDDEGARPLGARPAGRARARAGALGRARAFFAEARASGLVGADGALAPAAARVATQLAVQHALRAEVAAASNGVTGRPTLGFQAVDALVRLVAALARGEAGEGGAAMASSHTVLPDFLAVLSGVLTKDADDREASFNGRPYFRLILGLMAELLPEADALEDEGRDDDAGGRRLAVASARARAGRVSLHGAAAARAGFWLRLAAAGGRAPLPAGAAHRRRRGARATPRARAAPGRRGAAPAAAGAAGVFGAGAARGRADGGRAPAAARHAARAAGHPARLFRLFVPQRDGPGGRGAAAPAADAQPDPERLSPRPGAARPLQRRAGRRGYARAAGACRRARRRRTRCCRPRCARLRTRRWARARR
ncbi:hypothetical protein QBZ16_001796 [Prototheca wickerhamii]|uniref:Uncharacterized protein n=1 Tax=Prototheca wickerhamii TaxID=3111 RepID=A0AAD9IE08_PROWI|nr:hypothetical protein QBZ16_001796 [Prototheca wickerhamii]